MTDTTENRIDVTRPLELSNGTPVTFVRIDYEGDIVVQLPDGDRDFYRPDTGERYGLPGDHRLRNVAEAHAAPATPTFDPTKPVQTRDGRKARIVATLAGNAEYPLLAVYEDSEGNEVFDSFNLSGHLYGTPTSDDLINVPERIERYRTFRFDGHDLRLGPIAKETHQVARQLAADVDGVIKTITEDGKLISIEVVREDEA